MTQLFLELGVSAECVTRLLGLHMALVIELIGFKYLDVLPWMW